MSQNLYIATTTPGSGKSLVLLGVMQLLSTQVERLRVFRPIVRSDSTPDNDIELARGRYCPDQPRETTFAVTHEQAMALMTAGREQELLKRVLAPFKRLQQDCDFVVCEGTDHSGIGSPFDVEFDARIASHIGCPVLTVANGCDTNEEDLVSLAHMTREVFENEGCSIIGAIINRVPPEQREAVAKRLEANWPYQDHVYVIPEHDTLARPTVEEIFRSVGGRVLQGENGWLKRNVRNTRIAAMHLSNFLGWVEEGSLIIAPGDRSDVILGGVAAAYSEHCPTIAGVILTGGLQLSDQVARLISGFHGAAIPMMSVPEDTYETAVRVSSVCAVITPDNERKVATALGVFEENIDVPRLRERIAATRSTRVTPIMFEYELIERAKSARQHIVLPEGEDERILRAADILLRRDVVDITLLGSEQRIRELTPTLNLDLHGATIIDPADSDRLDKYIDTYFEVRKHKGITKDHARDTMHDASYFGTMMVHLGDADGMVSGATHTTAHTIRPAFEFIRARADCSLVSSVFLMCLKDRVLVYGDCAVNPRPTAEQLADIAIRSAETAEMFGIAPRVAMLSYSTGQSGKGEDVEKVRLATRIAKQLRPDIELEGPIQYDAAIDVGVAKAKMPDSEVAGRATVFVFPDLNTGNNTYKAVQRSANAIAIGPVLQGLRKPVNDLSRGCSVADIVNTVAITAIQAQGVTKTVD